MRRKTMSVIWFVVSAVSIVLSQQPAAAAHFTLGKLTGTFRFHDQDFDPHVPGPTAFLWPSAGFAAITGTASGLPPGYQSPWPNGKPPLAQSSWYQLEGTAYAPFGSILTSTPDHANIGDLVLGINLTRPKEVIPVGVDVLYSGIYIYIPPEFKGITASQIVTSITNDYSQISVSTAPLNDPFAPGWIRVSVNSASTGFIMSFRANDDVNHDGVGYDEWYYVRLNGLVAPEIAGRYFFKILLRMTGRLSYSYPASSEPPTIDNLYMPIQNWPVLLVKGEVDPAILHGTIRYGTWNMTLYNQPIPVSGRVRAVGRAVNPYTGEITSRYVEARGYFNESAQGHYEVEGLAPGVYDIYASAAGFPEQQTAASLLILRGQSLDLDGYLNPGPVVSGQVFSKSRFGEVPWSGLKPIRIEIYATDDYTAGNMVSHSPANMTGGRWGVFAAGNVSGISYSWTPGLPPEPTRVAFSWESGQSYYSDGTIFASSGVICGGAPDPCGVPEGVGPGRFWWVDPNGVFTNGGGSNGFLFQFGSKGIFGAPANMSGYVPQALATWVDGLEPGRYFLRAFVNGYAQSTPDGQHFQEYFLDVAAREWAGDVFVPIDLYATSAVNVTVHLHDLPGTLKPSPTARANSLLVELYDDNSYLVAMNFSLILPGSSSASVLLTGLGLHGSNPNRRFSLYAYRGFGFQDYGIPPGIYHMKAYVEGYLQKDDEDVTVGMGEGIVNISTNLYHGAAFELTLYSQDWEHPPIQRNWKWPGERIMIQVYNSTGFLIDTQPFLVLLQQPNGRSSVDPFSFDGNHDIVAAPGAEFLALLGTKPIGYSNGSYIFKVSTYGYIQPALVTAYGVEGNSTTDVRINLIIGANLTVNVKFRVEGIFANVPYNMSMRIRIFNDVGDLIGAWLTGSADDVLNFAQLEAGLRQDPNQPGFLESLDPVHRAPFLVWWVPGGTTDLEVTVSGIPSPYLDPVFPDQTAYGIEGSPSYTGVWTAEVDAVNWYLPTSFCPPVPGLLQGESYHFVQSESYPYLWTGDILSANHLGPFSQLELWLIPNTFLGSEVSTIQSLELNGYVQGQVLVFTWSDEVRSASWIRIEALNSRNLSLVSYSLDGFFDMYLPAGEYSLNVTEWTSRSEGHKNLESLQLHVSAGQNVHSADFVLDESAIPLAESLNVAQLGVLLIIALASISFGQRFRKNTRVSTPQTEIRCQSRLTTPRTPVSR